MGRAVRNITIALKRGFYKVDGPWYRNRLFEAFGSRRYARPALHGLDEMLERLLDYDGGVFVEAGAHDGFTQSNTYYLERHRNWSGVLVEPVPSQHQKCARRRGRSQTFNCALVSNDHGSSTVSMHAGDLMSVVSGERGAISSPADHAGVGADFVRRPREEMQVPARTLSDVLDEAGSPEVDVLVLDVEGYEMEALRGLDRARHKPRLILIEMLDADARQPEFDRFLAPEYRPVSRLTPCDVLYELRPLE